MKHEKDPFREFVKLFRERRLALGLSQAAVGRRMGLTNQSVCNMEAGKHRLTGDNLFRWAEALGLVVTVDVGAPPKLVAELVAAAAAALNASRAYTDTLELRLQQAEDGELSHVSDDRIRELEKKSRHALIRLEIAVDKSRGVHTPPVKELQD